MLAYVGVGVRKTSQQVLNYVQDISAILATKNYILRSGGTYGVDTAFEIGCDRVGGKKEIYLPCKNYENNQSELYDLPNHSKAVEIIKKHNLNWNLLSSAVKNMQTRNIFQLLGRDLQTKAAFVICWSDNSGSLSQVTKIAKIYNIPIFNLKLEKILLNNISPENFIEYVEQKTIQYNNGS